MTHDLSALRALGMIPVGRHAVAVAAIAAISISPFKETDKETENGEPQLSVVISFNGGGLLTLIEEEAADFLNQFCELGQRLQLQAARATNGIPLIGG